MQNSKVNVTFSKIFPIINIKRNNEAVIISSKKNKYAFQDEIKSPKNFSSNKIHSQSIFPI